MNGISIRIEQADFIGKVMDDEVSVVGKIGGSDVFFDKCEGELIICQPDQCVVIKK